MPLEGLAEYYGFKRRDVTPRMSHQGEIREAESALPEAAEIARLPKRGYSNTDPGARALRAMTNSAISNMPA